MSTVTIQEKHVDSIQKPPESRGAANPVQSGESVDDRGDDSEQQPGYCYYNGVEPKMRRSR